MSPIDTKDMMGYAQAPEGGKAEPVPGTVDTIDRTLSMAAKSARSVGRVLKNYQTGEVRIGYDREPGEGNLAAPAIAIAAMGSRPGFGVRAAEWHVDGSRYPMAYADQLPMAAGAMARPVAAEWHSGRSDHNDPNIALRILSGSCRIADEDLLPGAMAGAMSNLALTPKGAEPLTVFNEMEAGLWRYRRRE